MIMLKTLVEVVALDRENNTVGLPCFSWGGAEPPRDLESFGVKEKNEAPNAIQF